MHAYIHTYRRNQRLGARTDFAYPCDGPDKSGHDSNVTVRLDYLGFHVLKYARARRGANFQAHVSESVRPCARNGRMSARALLR